MSFDVLPMKSVPQLVLVAHGQAPQPVVCWALRLSAVIIVFGFALAVNDLHVVAAPLFNLLDLNTVSYFQISIG